MSVAAVVMLAEKDTVDAVGGEAGEADRRGAEVGSDLAVAHHEVGAGDGGRVTGLVSVVDAKGEENVVTCVAGVPAHAVAVVAESEAMFASIKGLPVADAVTRSAAAAAVVGEMLSSILAAD